MRMISRTGRRIIHASRPSSNQKLCAVSEEKRRSMPRAMPMIARLFQRIAQVRASLFNSGLVLTVRVMSHRPRILTGDTPTGKLHIGHYVGSVENRLALQDQYDCYFIIANKHAFTTRADKPEEIRQSVIEIATDYLAAG